MQSHQAHMLVEWDLKVGCLAPEPLLLITMPHCLLFLGWINKGPCSQWTPHLVRQQMCNQSKVKAVWSLQWQKHVYRKPWPEDLPFSDWFPLSFSLELPYTLLIAKTQATLFQKRSSKDVRMAWDKLKHLRRATAAILRWCFNDIILK